MSMNISVQENWTIEPELTEMPPRRVVAADYTDLNRPNPMLIYGAGGVFAILGIVLLIIGLNGKDGAMMIVLGILVTIAGAGVIGFLGPFLIRRHMMRGEHLVKNGVPVMARILSAENMSGDFQYGRAVTYQVALPNGEIIHKHVNADDRLLPRKIPANATALMDVETSDVELYCALPYKVAPNPAVLAARQAAAEAPVGGVATPTTPGQMSTIQVAEVPTGQRREKPLEEETKPTQPTSTGLPWE